MRTILFPALAALLESILLSPASANTKAQVLHVFTDKALNLPGSLLVEPSGVVFGVTTSSLSSLYNQKSVFRLSPAQAGGAPIKFQTVYNFPSGADIGPLIRNKVGHLIALDQNYQGACCGVDVVELAPPVGPGSSWSAVKIFDFGATNGNPYYFTQENNILAIDAQGRIYGLTLAYPENLSTFEVFYSLTPPTTGAALWSIKILYKFPSRVSAATLQAAGDGTFYGLGFISNLDGNGGYSVVYEFAPPKGSNKDWSYNVRYRFAGSEAGGSLSYPLVRDKNGNIFGVAQTGGSDGLGLVYELPHRVPGQVPIEVIIHSFSGGADASCPNNGLVQTPSGSLIGASSFGGVGFNGAVFELTPPASGQTAWTETVPLYFGGDESILVNSVVLGTDGHAYGTIYNGGHYHSGLVYRVQP